MDGKCTRIESELCICKYKQISTILNERIKTDLISNGIPQVYHVQLFLHVHFVKTFCIFLALESPGGNCENNPIWQAMVRFPWSPKNTPLALLLGGFNPVERYACQICSSPQVGVKLKNM